MFKLHYLGRQAHIRALYAALARQRKALHPLQLSKETDLDIFAVQSQLQACPELFVKLPRNSEGMVLWRLTSVATSLEEEAIEALIRKRARSEQLMVVATVSMLASLLLLVLLTTIPAIWFDF